MTGRDDSVRPVAERIVEIFTAAHGRPPTDIDELDTFIEMQVRRLGRAGLTRPHGYALRQ
jgi:hypothetical protein